MVSIKPTIENRVLPQAVSKAEPLHKLIEGEFGEGATYDLNGKSYNLRDLPDYVRNASSLVIELYLKLKENDNQR